MLCRNPCACHTRTHFEPQKTFRAPGVSNRSRAQAWCKFWRLQLHPQFLKRFGLPNLSRAQAWCIFWQLKLPKVLRGCQFWTILTSQSLSRAGVVQILATSISISAPNSQFWTILTSKSLSRAGVVQILSHLEQPILRTRPFLGADFPSQRSHKTMENTAFLAIPTRQILMSHISAVPHLCCITSLLYHICGITSLGWQIFSSNSQYSRKLVSQISFDNWKWLHFRCWCSIYM